MPKAKEIQKPEPLVREAPVTVHVYPTGTLFFREGVGSGEYNGVPVELALTIGGGTMLVHFEDDGVWYAFTPEKLIAAAWSIREASYAALAAKAEGGAQ